MKSYNKAGRSSNTPILLSRARNFSEPPKQLNGESRVKNPNLPPIEINSSNMTSSQILEEKPLVNLKQVLMIEEKLSEILEKLRQGPIDKSICDDYWALTEDSSIPYLEKLFTEKRTQTTLRHACIIEMVTVAFANICFSDKMPSNLSQNFCNLFYYVHQNFLTIMKLMLYRCSNDSLSNSWTHILRTKVQEKQATIGVKGGVSGFMKHHTALASKILECITSIGPVPLRPALMSVLKIVYCPTYIRARKMIESILLGISTIMEIPEDLPMLPTSPYLPNTDKEYTLILDLDETLVHYVDNGPESRLNIRPGCSDFLIELKKYYELSIFTAALQDYADWAIDSIDTEKSISYRLYRQHTMQTGPVFIKDLSRLGRDLSKVIIVDNVAENFRLQPGNGLFIKSWFDDVEDTCLAETMVLLREIALSKAQDVRVALRNYRDQVLRQIIKGVSNPLLNFVTSK
ncbi:hypothetical protein SteCoe_28007 [Stentor coeruleus]|uniref:Mitochondrial import inner membrane translocase subunit TIM50 n=1 Tax=Stentor coeruleus TaxID=5963 RepID=A0A1R2B957_9CILI|nr:hypothetical protein SteCoe_28007 [Stentor coeruleus]